MPIPAIVAGVGAIGGAIGQGVAGAEAAKQQQQAAADARRRQEQMAEANRKRIEQNQQDLIGGGGIHGRGVLQEYGEAARRALTSGTRDAMMRFGQGFDEAESAVLGSRDIISDAERRAQGQLGGGYQQGRQDVLTGFGQARQDIAGSTAQGARTLQDAYGRTAGDIYGGMERAAGLFDPSQTQAAADRYAQGATTAVGGRDVSGARSRLSEFYEGGGNIDLESNPAYKARMQAAMQAADTMSAAQGGRAGSAAEKRRMGIAGQLASEEYERAYGRQVGLAGDVDTQQQALLAEQAKREQESALKAQSYQAGLAELGYKTAADQQSQLSDLYAGAGSKVGELGAGLAEQQADLYGMQGKSMAGLSSDQALTLGDMSTQQGINTAGLTTDAATGQVGVQNQLAGLGIDRGAGMADLLTGQAAGLANQYTAQAGQVGQVSMGSQGMTQNVGAQETAAQTGEVPYAGGEMAAVANTFGSLSNMAGSLGAAYLGGGGGGGAAPGGGRGF